MPKRNKKTSYLLKKLKKKSRGGLSNLKRDQYVKGQAERMKTQKTLPERIFEKLLIEIGVEFESQKIVGKKIFDYYVPSKNALIEVDGDYYHANPDKYKKHDRNRMQESIVKNDKFKDILASGRGYTLHRVWESDLKNNYKIQVDRFRKLLK